MTSKTRRTKTKPAPKTRATRPPRKAKKPAAPAPEETAPEEAAPEAAPASPPEPELPASAFTPPEIEFSARVPTALPDRPRPSRRRAIFVDVENTSRASRVTEALEAMHIDHATAFTDIIASGNWRVIGNETARILAKKGAQLMHSAPATGVRDWSDLRIAVAAGVWLASARPGDRIDIVSDDKAFDAIGDVAATLGVEFNRHSWRKHGAHHEPEAPAAAPSHARAKASGRRRGRGGRGQRGPVTAPQAPAPIEAPPAAVTEEPVATEPGPAPHVIEAPVGAAAAPSDDLMQVVREELEKTPQGVMLDSIALRLKQLGFVRPPNSPRLVTRLRAMKELDVSPRGLVRLKGSGAPAAPATEGGGQQPPANGKSAGRRRRRGGRGRSGGNGAPPPSDAAQ